MNKHNNTTFTPENYVFEAGQHKDKKVIWIIFPNNKELALSLKKTMKAYWSGSNKKWYVADNFQHHRLLGLEPNYYKKSTLLYMVKKTVIQFCPNRPWHRCESII